MRTPTQRFSERLFREQLVGYVKGEPRGLATVLGWEHASFRPAQTSHGWRTPVTGELGKGWPDLTLVRARDRRLVFAELKADDGVLSPDQEHVLESLRSLAGGFGGAGARVDVVVWRPRDLDSGAIEALLR